MVSRTLSEAEKMARVPGTIFIDGGAGRRARVQGTGLEVFEIIGAYHRCGDSREQAAEAFHWLTPAQLDAAFRYYHAFPDEIDEWIEREADEMRADMRARGIEPGF